MGLGGGNGASWLKPMKNYWNRSCDIAAANIAPSFGIDLYNQKAAPTASYVPQLCEITKQVEQEELMALQRVFRLPHCRTMHFHATRTITFWKAVFVKSSRSVSLPRLHLSGQRTRLVLSGRMS